MTLTGETMKKDGATGELIVFTIENKAFGWAEVIAAAEVWGDWQPFVNETRQALSCLAYAGQTNQPASSEAVKEAATTFRYAHNLISAQDVQTWLNAWDLTVEGWLSCLRGQLLRERWAGRLEQIGAAYPVSEEQVQAVLQTYAVCAGKFAA